VVVSGGGGRVWVEPTHPSTVVGMLGKRKKAEATGGMIDVDHDVIGLEGMGASEWVF